MKKADTASQSIKSLSRKKQTECAITVRISLSYGPGGGRTLGISGWGCAARTLEPLAYTRASFSWILLPYTRVNSPNHSYPRVAVFQKLRLLAQSKAKPKQSLIITIASPLKKDLFILVRVFFPSSPKFQVNLIE